MKNIRKIGRGPENRGSCCVHQAIVIANKRIEFEDNTHVHEAHKTGIRTTEGDSLWW